MSPKVHTETPSKPQRSRPECFSTYRKSNVVNDAISPPPNPEGAILLARTDENGADTQIFLNLKPFQFFESKLAAHFRGGTKPILR